LVRDAGGDDDHLGGSAGLRLFNCLSDALVVAIVSARLLGAVGGIVGGFRGGGVSWLLSLQLLIESH
jgi:hypothetical protein